MSPSARYATASDVREDLRGHEDVLNFLRGILTSKGRMPVRVVQPQM